MIEKIALSKINKEKYNACLHQSINYKPYAEMEYLNSLTQGRWFCWVLNDYEAILPVCYEKKLFKTRIIQPSFCQQLGIFYRQPLPEEVFLSMIQKLKKDWIKNYSCNDHNTAHYRFKGANKKNFVLQLNESYDALFKKYNSNTKRNLKKLYQKNSECKMLESFDNASLQLLLHGNSRFQLSENSKEILAHLFTKMFSLKKAFVVQLYVENQLAGLAFFMHWENQIIYSYSILLSTQDEKGLMHGIIDYVIRKFSNTNTLLDFEGSMNKGISKFFSGFGATNHPFKVIG